MMFYCKGVIETVRKLGWKPDIVHCQGWFSSLVPMYLKKLYADDPLFEDIKIIYSVFDNSFKGTLSNDLTEKLLFEDLDLGDVDTIQKSNIINLHKFAIRYSDAVIQASPKMDKKILNFIEKTEKPFMSYPGDEEFIDAYHEFYNKFLNKEELSLI